MLTIKGNLPKIYTRFAMFHTFHWHFAFEYVFFFIIVPAETSN